MAKKIALGKGIASLIESAQSSVVREAVMRVERQVEEESKKEVVEMGSPAMVSVSEIFPNPNQPRKIFKEQDLEELANSIRENGIIQPLIVAKAERGFSLIAGERRLRASIKAGLSQVPVVIKRGTEKERYIMAIIENVQRSDLNCVEEALAYFKLMEDYNITQEEVAKKLGKERSSVANYLRVLKLPRDVVELLRNDKITFGHAKVLSGLKDERDLTIRLAHLAAKHELSVRELEAEIKKSKRKNRDVPVSKNQFFEEKLVSLKDNLEKRTGYHFEIKSKNNGVGHIVIKYNNEAEFNDIYEYLLK